MQKRLLEKINIQKLTVLIIFLTILLTPLLLKIKNGYVIQEQTEYRLLDSALKPFDLIYFPLTFFPNHLKRYELNYNEKDFAKLEVGLPKTIGAQELNRHLTDRVYIDGTFIANEKKYPVEISIHGEALANYVAHKKSLRLKFNEPFLGRTTWNLVIPEQRRFNSVGASEFLAKKLGILTQQWDYIWMRINNEQMGVYEMVDETDTSFIESNKLSTNDLVFREQIRPNVVSGNLTMSIFSPEGSWTLGNKPELEDTYAFSYIENLKEVNQLEGPDFWEKISKIIDMDEFLKWSAILYLLNDTHQNDYNNARLIYLKEKGQFWIMPDHIFVQPVTQFVDKTHRHSLNEKILSYPPNFWQRNKIIWSLISNPDFNEELNSYLNQKIDSIRSAIYQDPQKAFRYLTFKKTVDNQRNIINTNLNTVLHYFDLYDINAIIKNSSPSKTNDILLTAKIKATSFFQPKLDSITVQLSSLPKSQNLNVYYDINQDSKVDSSDILISAFAADTSTRTQVLNTDSLLLATKFNSSVYDTVKPIATSHIIVQSEKPDGLEVLNTKLSFSNSLTGEKLSSVEEFVKPRSTTSSTLPEFIKEVSLGKFIIQSGTYSVASDIEIPDGELTIEPGAIFEIAPKVSIISHANISALGQKTKPILFTKASEENWGSLVIINAKQKSTFTFVTIEYASGYNPMLATGALAAHFSDLVFDHGHITHSLDDDGINVKHAKATITNTLFDKNQGDHIDFDTVEGEISKNMFNNVGFGNNDSDGLDVSFSNLKVEGNTFYKMIDKCISVGEQSKLEIINNTLDSCKYGVAVKDGSTATLKNNIIKNQQIGVGTYMKKTLYGFGGTAIIISNNFEKNGEDTNEQSNSKIERR